MYSEMYPEMYTENVDSVGSVQSPIIQFTAVTTYEERKNADHIFAEDHEDREGRGGFNIIRTIWRCASSFEERGLKCREFRDEENVRKTTGKRTTDRQIDRQKTDRQIYR